MTKFRYLFIEVQTNVDTVNMIPEEYLDVHAYLLWENEGRPEGRALDHHLAAREYHKGFFWIPTEKYIRLEKSPLVEAAGKSGKVARKDMYNVWNTTPGTKD